MPNVKQGQGTTRGTLTNFYCRSCPESFFILHRRSPMCYFSMSLSISTWVLHAFFFGKTFPVQRRIYGRGVRIWPAARILLCYKAKTSRQFGELQAARLGASLNLTSSQYRLFLLTRLHSEQRRVSNFRTKNGGTRRNSANKRAQLQIVARDLLRRVTW
jgi:hypothetical protein